MADRIPFLGREFFVPSSQVIARITGLQKGDTVSAFVRNVTDEGAQLLIDGKQIFAQTKVPLQSGQFLRLEVTDIQPNTVVMRLTQPPDALSAELFLSSSAAAGAPASDAERLAQNLGRLLSTDIKSFILHQLSEFFAQLEQIPDNASGLLSAVTSGTQKADISALSQSLTQFMEHIALQDGTPQQILEKLSLFFTQYSDAQTRSLILKTFLSFSAQMPQDGQNASPAQWLNNFLLGLQVHNSLARLTPASPFFFLIPVVIQNECYPLKVYYYKEKQPRGKQPREKNHIVLFLSTPNLGVIKVHIWTHARKLSVVISSALPKIKIFLQPHLTGLREALGSLDFVIEELNVRVEKNLKDTFSLADALNKQLSLKSVNVRA